MMNFTPIDEGAYDIAQVEIGYAKMFPLIADDFLTRTDCKEMMKSSNLTVVTQAGQTVSTAGTPVKQEGATTSPGKGQVNVAYKGGVKRSGTATTEGEKKAVVEGGGAATGSALGALADVG